MHRGSIDIYCYRAITESQGEVFSRVNSSAFTRLKLDAGN
jgi:hypothetical protein